MSANGSFDLIWLHGIVHLGLFNIFTLGTLTNTNLQHLALCQALWGKRYVKRNIPTLFGLYFGKVGYVISCSYMAYILAREIV